MPERHSAQNRFTGGFIRQPSRRGGTRSVGEGNVIALDGCWCGLPLDHNWPGKAGGAPHPRETRGMTVGTTQEQEHVRLAPGDIRKFSKPIRDLLLEIVNDFKVRWRAIDGGHIILYPPDGSRMFKVSAAREDKNNRNILENQFMARYGLVRAKPEAKPEPEPDPEPKTGLGSTVEPAQEQPVSATPEEVLSTTTYVGTDADVTDAVRQAIATLTAALGVESLEDEALHALDENEALKKRNREIAEERDRFRSLADAERQNAERQKSEREKFEGLLNEAITRADKAEAKIATLKELFA